MPCVDENTLAAFFEGRLDDAAASEVELHLDVCDGCRTVLAVLVRAAPAREVRERIGRYEVLGVLGRGGMGIVYLARDPELGRRVALKLVLGGVPGDAERRARLLREAQTMAQLSHPNVAQVHDAGALDDGQVFVALEYVEGQTLASWMRHPRPWRAIVAVMIAAGRGLAAAHAAGIVHRDFKPANVLVGDDGRVRVADFGLARADERVATDAIVLDSAVTTRTGALLGSPAYMAPEQLARERADERSDQFAFAVTLYEALHGKRPFEAPSIDALATAIEAGPTLDPARVPAAVRRIVARGLRARPDERYPSMTALVDALERATRRSRVVVHAAAGLAIAATSGIAVALLVRGAPACEPPRDRIAPVLAQRDAIARAFAATKLPYADTAAARVRVALEAYVERWSAAHVEACTAARVREETSESVLDRRMACLDRRLHDVTALATAFTTADAGVVQHATRAVAALPSIEACADLAAVLARVPPPEPAQRTAVEQLRDELANVRTLRTTGRYPDAGKVVAPLVERARATAYPPVVGEALLELGEIHTKLDDAKAAMTAFDEAARTAYAASDDATAARAWIAIVYAAGYSHAEPATAEHAAKMAKAALARMPADDRLQGQLAAYEGILLHARGDYRGALARYAAAGSSFAKLSPRQTELEASLRNALANTRAALGEPSAAAALLREAIAMRVDTLGATHPDTIVNRANLGTMLARQGKFADALVELDRAIADAEQSLGPTHPDVATYLANSCHPLESVGNKPEALARARRALAIYEAAVGTEDPRTLAALTIVAKLVPPDEALPLFDRALALQATRLGDTHPSLATTLNNLGQAHADRGDHAAALAAYTRALAIAEPALGPEHPRLAYSLVGIARARSHLGDAQLAIPPLRRALAIGEKAELDPASVGEVRFALATALWPIDRAGARALAEKARATFVEVNDTEHAAEIARWLASRR